MLRLACAYQDLEQELCDKFGFKKEYSSLLADSYKRIGYEKKAERVSDCGTLLDVGVYEEVDGTKTASLRHANFCKDPLCPMCAWRKSLKIFNQTYKCAEILQRNYDFVFVTLTCANCKADKLSETFDLLSKAYGKLMRRKKLQFVKGAFKALEVTYDNHKYITKKMYYDRQDYYKSRGLYIGDPNPNYEYFHPHIHAIWVVEKGYFSSDDYLDIEDLVKIWQKCLKVDYQPVCYIKKIYSKKKKKNPLASSVAEVAKYPVKCTDFLLDDKEKTDYLVKTLTEAFDHRHMFQFYGIFKDIRQQLNFDEIDDNLVNVNDEDDARPERKLLYIMSFRWNKSAHQYDLYRIREPDEDLLDINPPPDD